MPKIQINKADVRARIAYKTLRALAYQLPADKRRKYLRFLARIVVV